MGTWALWKWSLWGGSEKTQKNMKSLCKNDRFLMARNDVWRYTLRLFHTFALFETNRKIDAKREPNNYFFEWKMIPRAPKVWFILPFWLFFEGSRNHCCFDAFLGGQKIEKIRPWSAQGSPRGLRPFSECTVPSPRGPHTDQKKNRFTAKQQDAKKGSRHAHGR